MLARKNKSDDGNISRRCQTANLMQNLRQGTADGWRKQDGGAQLQAHGGVLAHAVAAAGRPPAAATACRAANTPPANTYRTIAANGMRRYTRMYPATSRHAALIKSDIRILTGLSHLISGFGKNSILTSLIYMLLDGRQEEHPACKNWVVKKLTWLSVWSICFDCHDLHTVSWCHCHPITSCFSKTQNGLPFWRRLTRAVLEKRPLNGCSSGSSSSSTISFGKNNVSQHVQLIYWSAVTP